MSVLRSLPVLVLALVAGASCARHRAPAGPEPGRSAAPAARETPRAAEREREKEREREPAEYRLSVCALAPHSPRGLRTLEAVHVEGRPDTLALVEGRRVPLAEAVGEVLTARQTTWFPARKPLTLVLGARTVRYLIYDVGRIIEPGDLAYLGTVGGLPVYAAASDVAAGEKELRALLATERDLEKLLARSAPLRAQLRATDVLYVPLSRTGCMFQPLLREGS